MVPRLKLAAKAGLFAASLVSASLVADAAQAPTADADSDAPETVAVAAAAFGYRLAAAGTRARDDATGLAKDADPSERWLAKYDAESAEAKDEQRLRPIGGFGANEQGLFDLSGNVWEWTDTCFVRYSVGPAGVQPVTTNCGVRVVEGEHRTYITDFIRDARAGGCAMGKPPANLGVRLVNESGTLSALVARIKIIARGGVAWL